MNKKILIIGAGPAGLTAAYQLLKKTNTFEVLIIEKLNTLGGISRTINYKGNRMDLGGHRFFTKSEIIKNLWCEFLPIQGKPAKDEIITGSFNVENYSINGPDPEKEDRVMLVRKRLSRIYYLKKFFDYPVSLNLNTIKNLGIRKITAIGLGYLKSQILPIKPEKSLEDFFINRFGYELYNTFFKDYTEKVWGIKCNEISSEWGVQRVKGLSIKSIIKDIILSAFSKRYVDTKKVETTLIRKFYYPKFGPGQMWNEMAKYIKEKGGKILKNTIVTRIKISGNTIKSVIFKNLSDGKETEINIDYLISSMPIKELIMVIDNKPAHIEELAKDLKYRSFITTGLFMKKLKIKNETQEKTINNIIPDNWIYLQDKDIKAGRLQIFNNWSPYLVSDLNKVWIGVEYFCDENDELWRKKDNELIDLALSDLQKAGIIDKDDFIDGTVERVENAYPAYFGKSYERFNEIKDYLNSITNLYSIGRNGMHRYNNMDHSMLSAIEAVNSLLNGTNKENIWKVNTEKEYHEG